MIPKGIAQKGNLRSVLCFVPSNPDCLITFKISSVSANMATQNPCATWDSIRVALVNISFKLICRAKSVSQNHSQPELVPAKSAKRMGPLVHLLQLHVNGSIRLLPESFFPIQGSHLSWRSIQEAVKSRGRVVYGDTASIKCCPLSVKSLFSQR